MNDKREINGLWWLPSQPEKKWIGTLFLASDKSPELTVKIPESFFSFLNATRVHTTLFGHDQAGLPVTLFYVGLYNSEGSGALSQLHFRAGWAVLGMEVPAPADFVVNSLSFRIQHLYEWGSISGFEPTERQNLDVKIGYRQQEDLIFNIDSNLAIKLRVTCSFQNGRRKKQIEEDLIVGFESPKGIDLKQVQHLLNTLRHLLHFAVLQPVFPLKISAQKANHGYMIEDNFIPLDIELWNSIIREPVESEFDPKRWIYRFPDLQPQFGQFYSEWLKFSEEYHEAVGCYTNTVYNPMTAEVRLLCLTQALEAYHSIKNSSHQQAPFRTKILEIANLHSGKVPGLISNTDEFADSVRDNRHYYTHHNPKYFAKRSVLRGADLTRLNEKLKLLFQMCILTEIGIPSDRFVGLKRQLASYIIDYS